MLLDFRSFKIPVFNDLWCLITSFHALFPKKLAVEAPRQAVLSHKVMASPGQMGWSSCLICLLRSSLAIKVKLPGLNFPGSILILYERTGTYICFPKSPGYLNSFQRTVHMNRCYIVDFIQEATSGCALPLWLFLPQSTVGRGMYGSIFSAHCIVKINVALPVQLWSYYPFRRENNYNKY